MNTIALIRADYVDPKLAERWQPMWVHHAATGEPILTTHSNRAWVLSEQRAKELAEELNCDPKQTTITHMGGFDLKEPYQVRYTVLVYELQGYTTPTPKDDILYVIRCEFVDESLRNALQHWVRTYGPSDFNIVSDKRDAWITSDLAYINKMAAKLNADPRWQQINAMPFGAEGFKPAGLYKVRYVVVPYAQGEPFASD